MRELCGDDGRHAQATMVIASIGAMRVAEVRG